MLAKTATTYAEMIATGAPSETTHFKVATDETTGGTNVLYEWWPDGTLIWIPSGSEKYQIQYDVDTYAEMMTMLPSTVSKIFFVKADEMNKDDYGQYDKPGVYMYVNGVLNKVTVRKNI